MNRRGFTLIELLAVIVLIGILTVITIPIAVNQIEKSKKKGEDIFKSRLTDVIEEYITLNTSYIPFNSSGVTKEKCNSDDDSCYNVTVYQNSNSISLNNLISQGLITL